MFGATHNIIREELQRMVDGLEDTVDCMKEFFFFLESYPWIICRPYSAYFVIEYCMFGRQPEW
jgi:hypothetical protein